MMNEHQTFFQLDFFLKYTSNRIILPERSEKYGLGRGGFYWISCVVFVCLQNTSCRNCLISHNVFIGRRVRDRPALHHKILLYEPVTLGQMYRQVREEGVRCNIAQLQVWEQRGENLRFEIFFLLLGLVGSWMYYKYISYKTQKETNCEQEEGGKSEKC